MKKGFSMFSFSENENIEKVFKLVKNAGYDGVEPVLSDGGYLNLNTSEKEIMAIKKLADDLGLEIPSVGVWSLWENNLVSNSKTIREKAIDIVKKQIECAEILGANTILVVPGYVGCDFATKPERVRYDIAYNRSLEAFAKLLPFAEKAEVNIAIENVWNKFLLSPIEVRSFIDELKSDNMGVYFDIGNILYIGYPEDWIEILAHRIKKLHICDYRTSQAGIGAFVDVFAGDVDYKKVVASLKKIAYDDYLTLEMFPNYKDFPEISMYSNKPAIDLLCKMLDEA